MESKARILNSNHDLDDFWESYGHYIEGRLVEIVRRQEIYCEDMSFDQLQEMLVREIPRGNYFKTLKKLFYKIQNQKTWLKLTSRNILEALNFYCYDFALFEV